MFAKFTARRPKARKAPVEPLQDPKEVSEKAAAETPEKAAAKKDPAPKELGGPSGPEPTRYGDWERKGICVDF